MVQIAQNHARHNRDQGGDQAHDGNVRQAGGAQGHQGQEGAVVDGQNRHAGTVNIVAVSLHQRIVNTSVAVGDGADDGHAGNTEHAGRAENPSHKNAEDGTDDELGNQQQAAPLDNRRHFL